MSTRRRRRSIKDRYFEMTVTTSIPDEIFGISSTFKLDAIVGKQCAINWGDGQATTLTGTGSTGQAFSHTYSVAGTYKIKISNQTSLTYLRLYDLPNCTINSGVISNLTSLISLTLFNLPNCTINGGEISNLTSLTYLRLYKLPNCTINGGEISNLTNLTSLTLSNFNNCTINGGEISNLTSLTYLTLSNFSNCTINNDELLNCTSADFKTIYFKFINLTQSLMDNVLSNVVDLGVNSGALTLLNGTTVPSAAGLADEAILEADPRLWAVTIYGE